MPRLVVGVVVGLAAVPVAQHALVGKVFTVVVEHVVPLLPHLGQALSHCFFSGQSSTVGNDLYGGVPIHILKRGESIDPDLCAILALLPIFRPEVDHAPVADVDTMVVHVRHSKRAFND